MKKFTAILLMVIMVASLFTSCSNSIAPNIDETVSVSFEESASRSLTASIPGFNAGSYYWRYAAKKTDTTGLTSGETPEYSAAGSLPVKTSGKGLANVPGFSQGSWKFMLFAYEDQGYTKLIYSGENKNVTLKKGSTNSASINSVSIVVSPISDAGNGTLLVDVANINLVPKDGSTLTAEQIKKFTKFVTVTLLSDLEQEPIDQSASNTWTLAPGAYKVTVDFRQGGFIYASGSVVATVYQNITTTVSGPLEEMVTHAEFDPSRNPDIINKVASNSVDYSTLQNSESIKLTEADSVEEGNRKVEASVPAGIAVNAIKSVAGNDPAADTSVDLQLSVDTTAASSSSVTLEIKLQAVVTKTEGNGDVSQTSVPVTSDIIGLNIVTVTVKLQPNLSGVTVTHSGTPMEEISKTNNIGYSYNANTGDLIIQTNSFSPFEVHYIASVARVNGKTYSTIERAVSAANARDTVEILSGEYTLSSALTIDKAITLKGVGNAVIKVSNGKNIILSENAINVVFDSLSFITEDKTVNIIEGYGTDAVIRNCTFTGVYNKGDGETSRGFTFNAGTNGYLVENNYFKNLRQPAYLQGNGTVKNNTIENTRGWVVTCNTPVTFVNNKFEGWNAEDIAIIGTNNLPANEAYSVDNCVTISANNNNCRIDQQVDGFRVNCSDVSDAYVALNTTNNVAFKSFGDACTNAKDGDTIHLLKDIVINKTIKIEKNITLDGLNHVITADNDTNKAWDALYMKSGSAIKDLTLKHDSSGTYSNGLYIANTNSASTVTINNCKINFPRPIQSDKAMNISLTIKDSELEGTYSLNGTWKKLSVSNSVLKGWTSFGAAEGQEKYVFKNTSFAKSYAGYAMLKGYNNYDVENCVFSNEFIKPDNDDSDTHFGIATGTKTPITLNFITSKVVSNEGVETDISAEILSSMFNYAETSGSSSGDSTIDLNYWQINGVQVYGPVTE